jgi:hypothetical protein
MAARTVRPRASQPADVVGDDNQFVEALGRL